MEEIEGKHLVKILTDSDKEFLGKADDIFTPLVDAIKMETYRNILLNNWKKIQHYSVTHVVVWIN